MNKSRKKQAGAKKFSFAKVDAFLDSVWKKMTSKIPENVLTSIILLTFGAVLLGIFVLPQKIEDYQCNRFATPLFEHLMPTDCYAVQISSTRDEQGGTTAAIILGVASDLTQQEIVEFYSDTEYPPAREGEMVELVVNELDEGSISALRQAGRHRDGDRYYFVYLYSSQK